VADIEEVVDVLIAEDVLFVNSLVVVVLLVVVDVIVVKVADHKLNCLTENKSNNYSYFLMQVSLQSTVKLTKKIELD
jgi:hypothetical protein